MTFESEADLCDRFIDAAKAEGWIAYAEQGDWDLVLVRRGVQVGVQAKLVGNLHMIFQALPDRPRGEGKRGPHYRAVLVGRWPGRTPKARQNHRNELCGLAMRLRLLVLEPPESFSRRGWLNVNWPFANLSRGWGRHHRSVDFRWYRWPVAEPVWIPPFVPDLPAGVPCPSTVSAFQVACVKLERLCDARGWICLDDARDVLKELGGKWNPATPLGAHFENTGERAHGRQMKWKLRPRIERPSKRWPEVAAGMKGDHDGENGNEGMER